MTTNAGGGAEAMSILSGAVLEWSSFYQRQKNERLIINYSKF